MNSGNLKSCNAQAVAEVGVGSLPSTRLYLMSLDSQWRLSTQLHIKITWGFFKQLQCLGTSLLLLLSRFSRVRLCATP